MQIGKYNQLQEWLEDLDNPNDKHRHISHVYGLFPSNPVSYTHLDVYKRQVEVLYLILLEKHAYP